MLLSHPTKCWVWVVDSQNQPKGIGVGDMRYTLRTVTAPGYAPDGSRGYMVTIDRATDSGTQQIQGWVDRAGDGIIATLDSYPWKYVARDDSALSPEWIAAHVADIVGIYGWSNHA